MGFLSSLFQSNPPTQQVAGAPINTSKLPEELAPYYKDIMGKAQALYNDRTAEGYKPYSGPTIADFTPEQQQAFTGISGLQGSQAPIFDEALNMTRTAATPMTQDQLTSYMSPYQQAVTDIEKREATKQYEGQVQPQLAAQAAATGGFGGSRQAILEGMAADTQQRLLGDIQAKGSAQGYQDAVSRFTTDRTAQGQAGAQLAQIAPNQFKAQLGEIGAMQTVGEQKQKQSQTALDEAFRQYQLERDDPYNTMGKYQSVITGAPVQQTTFAPVQPQAPSTAQTLISGLGTVAGAYGAFSNPNAKSFFPSKEGGGIADNIVYAENGTTGGLEDLLKKMGVSRYTEEEVDTGESKGVFPGDTGERGEQGKKVVDFVKGLGKKAVLAGENIYDRVEEAIPDDPRDTKEFKEYEIQQELAPQADAINRMPNPEAVNAPPVPKGLESIPLPNQIVQPKFEGVNPNAPVVVGQPQPIDGSGITQPSYIDPSIATEKDLALKEQAYLDSLQIPKGQTKERTAQIQDQKQRANYAAMAKYFARLGSTAPKQSGLLGFIGAATEAAPDSIDEVQAINSKAMADIQALRDKEDEVNRAIAKANAGVALSKNERAVLKDNKRTEKIRYKEEAQLERDKLKATLDIATAEANAVDVDSGDMNSLESSIDKMLGGKTIIGADGQATRIDGIELNPDSLAKFNILRARAKVNLGDAGNIVNYNKIHGEQLASDINSIIEGNVVEGEGGEEVKDSNIKKVTKKPKAE